MANIFLNIGEAGSFQVVSIDGICYERVGDSEEEADTFLIDEGFSTCLECKEAEPSPSPDPSPGP